MQESTYCRKKEFEMLTFLFFVLLFGIFGKLIWLAVKAAWGISKIVFSIVFLPVVVLVLFFSGLVYVALGLLVVIGIVSLIKGHI